MPRVRIIMDKKKRSIERVAREKLEVGDYIAFSIGNSVITLLITNISYSLYTDILQLKGEFFEKAYSKPEITELSKLVIVVNDLIKK